MFNLVTIEDTVLVPARLFGFAREQAMEHVLNKQLSDRVIPDVGLVIAVWDLLHIGQDRLIRNTGECATTCRFRVLVFAPFAGEVIFARVGLANDAGILAYLGFFDPVWVPKDALPRPSVYEPGDRVWVWRPKFDGETEMTYYMDSSTETVVRVTSVDYEANRHANAKRPVADTRTTNVMAVKASLFDRVTDDNQGLGDPAWWYEEESHPEDDRFVDPTEIADPDAIEGTGEGSEGDEQYAEGDADNQEDWAEDGGMPANDLIHEEGGEAAVDTEEGGEAAVDTEEGGEAAVDTEEAS